MPHSSEALHSLRALFRRPVFTCTSVFALAIGIGANTALFTVADRVLFSDLPYPEAGRLFAVEETRGSERSNSNPARLRDYAARLRAATSITGFYPEGLVLRGQSGARRIDAIRFAGSFLETLGVAPAIGRNFTAAELRAEGDPVAIITHRLWKEAFSGREDVIGTALPTRNATFTIVGVMPETFHPPVESAEIIAPAPRDLLGDNRKAGFLSLFARLKPGETPARLDQQLEAALASMAREYPSTDKGLRARAVPAKRALAGDYRLPLLLLMAVVALVLLTACINLAGVMLARTFERRREAAIRASIGADRVALMRLFFWESLWIAIGGGAAAAGVATVAIDFGVAAAGDAPMLAGIALDLRALAFTGGVSLLCAFAVGIAPAWRASDTSWAAAMRETRRSARLRQALSAGQSALSLVLLSATFVVGSAFLESRKTSLGFSTNRLWTIEVNLPWDTPEAQLRDFERRALDTLGALPGVSSVALTDRIPLAGSTQTRRDPIIEGMTLTPALSGQPFGVRAVSPELPATLGVAVITGKMFDTSGRQCVINEVFARRYFGSSNPVGRRISLGGARWLDVAGVIAAVRAEPLEQPPAEIYINTANTYWPMLDFLIKTVGDAPPPVPRALRSLDPGLVPGPLTPVAAAVDRAYGRPRLLIRVMGGFAVLALLLAISGLYGVMASNITSRTREFGVRLALGAEPRQIQWMALRYGLGIAAIGAAVGAASSAAGSAAAATYLPRASDPGAAVALAVLCLMLSAGAACWPLARRTARIDPAVTLRRD